jgi:hypothetical protein
VLPTEPSLQIKPHPYMLIAGFNLGKLPLPAPTICGLCSKRTGSDWAHALSCEKVIPVEGCKRHNGIGVVLRRWIERAGGACRLEPRKLCADSNKRPDGEVSLGLETIFFDVMVTNQNSAYNAEHKSASAMLEHHAGFKRRKYRDMTAQQHASFVPFILDVYGRMSDDASRFVERIVSFAGDNQTTYSTSQIREGILNELSVSLQVGNAAMLQRALNYHLTVKRDAEAAGVLAMDLSNEAGMA